MTTMRIYRHNDGFTLIELVVTLVIVALLSTVALPLSELVVQRQHEQELRVALREIRTAIDAYKQAWDEGRITPSVGKSGYPASLALLIEGINDPSDPNAKAKIYFLRRIPRDPFADASLSAIETWGKRSYASSADSPQEGEDVFDVYSRAAGKDLRGIPYRDW